MQDWQATALSSDVRVEIVSRQSRADERTMAEVDRLWAEACGARPDLFNGRVLSADHISPECILGHWTDYKFAYAQFKKPELFNLLGLRPLAVCGVVRCPDGIVFGQRSADAVYQAGMWQCPPAGSVEQRCGEDDQVDLRGQLLAEFEEELGLARQSAGSITPLAAVEHPGTHVVDVGFGIETIVPGSGIVDAQRSAPGSHEYARIVVVAAGQLQQRLENWAGALVPSARLFLADLFKRAG